MQTLSHQKYHPISHHFSTLGVTWQVHNSSFTVKHSIHLGTSIPTLIHYWWLSIKLKWFTTLALDSQWKPSCFTEGKFHTFIRAESNLTSQQLNLALIYSGHYILLTMIYTGHYLTLALNYLGHYLTFALIYSGHYLALALIYSGYYLALALIYSGHYLTLVLI